MPSAQRIPARGFTPKAIERRSVRSSGLVLRVHPSGLKSFRWHIRALDRVIDIGPWAPLPSRPRTSR